jgi:peptidoglycan/LPS O-acetylase OafA/YrhL
MSTTATVTGDVGTPAAPVRVPRVASAHRRDIEGLRAVAVLLVVAYHCGVGPITGGYVGVDVFFVISGFLITGLLLREIRTRGTISIPGFYARRALRLLPAGSVVVVATVAAAAWWLPPLRRDGILADALHTTFYGINYRLAAIGTDYLGAETDPSPLQHFWSLAVEEQFYLIWPPLLLAVAVGLRRGPINTTRVYAVLTVIVAGSFALSVWQTGANASWAYFGAHTRAWELGAGALVAAGAGSLARLSRVVAAGLGGAGLTAIGVSAVLYSPATPFPGSAALLPVLGTAAVIVGGCAVPSRLLSVPVLQGVGRLSYSWYLWHWPFLIIAPVALGATLSVWQNVLVAAVAFGAAMLTYALVENPARHLAALRDRPWRGVTAGIAASVLTAGLCLVITVGATHADRGSTYRAASITSGTFDVRNLPRVIADSVDAPAVPSNLTPKLAKAATNRPQFYRDGCSGDLTDAEVKTPCAYGDLTSPTTVVLFGDSHAGHWFPALETVALSRHWKLVVMSKSACHAADVNIYLDTLKRTFDECVVWRKAAFQRLRVLKPAMVVLVSTAQGGELPGIAQSDQDTAWTDGWTRSVDAAAASGAKVYYVNDTPWHGTIVPECLSAHLDDPQACARTRQAALLMPRRRQLVIDAATAHGASVIDPVPWFCTATACPVVIGNVLVYKDRHHMTTVYSRLLAPLLSAALTP